jgi:dipeptidyl aminopeptidase/acylaminoacyl peptidase
VRARIITCLILTFVAAANVQTTVSAEELVRFDSAPYVVGQIQQRQAIERGETLAKLTATIEGYLSKPDGAGPFPAIVYLHGCNGLSKSTRARIADLMTGWGYVSLAVDSFTSRDN